MGASRIPVEPPTRDDDANASCGAAAAAVNIYNRREWALEVEDGVDGEDYEEGVGEQEVDNSEKAEEGGAR